MSRKMFKTGVLGGIVTAICCFTPILVIIFSAVGLAAAIKYLDFVLFPMLAIFIVLAVVGFIKLRHE
ncbi:MAG: mercury resistance system transport protein MerF [Moritella sp.]|uniref:mercury resistance system transport protein MerF n=1 Tax=unclassified Moritella TaxID=2637987 RepID=UPI0005C50A8E|nr:MULTISPECIES: mercury resistance system transport protein MerF [unclassified Moritella]MBL1417101.1 mercury resistance system transport protein MerF [Moritella sp.]